MKRTPLKKALVAAVGLAVALAFLLSRIGVTPPEEGFDPADYVDAPVVPAEEAAAHVGSRATVCGRVEEATHATDVGGEPTFLNLDGRHPHQPFTAVIWGRHRPRFAEPPEDRYRGRQVCVSGVVREHDGTPQIEVRDPAQIQEGGASP